MAKQRLRPVCAATPLERPLERRPTLLFGAPCLLPPQADAYALPEYNHSMSRLL